MSLAAVVAMKGERTWLTRGDGSLFGGLFGALMADGHDDTAARDALETHGLDGRVLAEEPARVNHVLTHRILDVRVYRAVEVSGEATETLRTFSRAELSTVGVATLTKKILEAADASQLDLFRSAGTGAHEVPE